LVRIQGCGPRFLAGECEFELLCAELRKELSLHNQGTIAMKYEGKLEWDANNMRITNNREANKWLKPTFHKRWKFVG
jgi:hypothetical protein